MSQHSLQNVDCKYVEIVIKSDRNNTASSFHHQLDDSYSIEQREESCKATPVVATAAAATVETQVESTTSSCTLDPSNHVSRVVLLRSMMGLLLLGEMMEVMDKMTVTVGIYCILMML